MALDILKCPVCDTSDDFYEGEYVDVGFGSGRGYGAKVGPDTCDNCGYTERGCDLNVPPLEWFQKCWAEKIPPYPDPPECRRGEFSLEYAQWIKWNVQEYKDAYGQCNDVCKKMVRQFPELTIIHGTYLCAAIGPRHHSWCITAEGIIVDPTEIQFPSCGSGRYLPRFPVDPETLIRTDIPACREA